MASAIAGEGMPLERSRLDQAGQRTSKRAKFPRVVAKVTLAALLACANVSAACADDGSTNASGWSKFLQFMGVKQSSTTDINYTERAPLVVPPSRDLPAPAEGAGAPAADWPKDPTKRRKAEKAKAEIVPGTAVQTPNPPVEKKPWYNPAGWFDKEEYANFAGEPVRQNLTDPPAGYRIPSADQPYGIPPEKNKGKTQASPQDFTLGSVTPPASPGK